MLQDHRRRQDDQVRQGLPSRRPSRHVDRSAEPEADDQRQRRRRRHRATAARRGTRRRCRSASSTTCRSTTACRTASAAAMQDSAPRRARATACAGGITRGDWYDVGGGEAGHVVSDADDPDVVYAGEYLGIITRYDHRTRQSRNVSAWPENPSGHGGEDMKYRFQWTAPIGGSPHDPKVIYHAAQVLFRSPDGGQTWEVISPRPHAQRQGAAEMVGRPDHRRQHRRRDVRHDLRDGRVAEAEGPDLGRQRRRARARHARRRQDLEERDRSMPGAAARGHGQHHRAVAATTPAPPTSSSTRIGSTTCGRICSRRPTTARRGGALTADSPRMSICTPCVRIRSGGVCSISAPSAA